MNKLALVYYTYCRFVCTVVGPQMHVRASLQQVIIDHFKKINLVLATILFRANLVRRLVL
jgi:hypothetical protein